MPTSASRADFVRIPSKVPGVEWSRDQKTEGKKKCKEDKRAGCRASPICGGKSRFDETRVREQNAEEEGEEEEEEEEEEKGNKARMRSCDREAIS